MNISMFYQWKRNHWEIRRRELMLLVNLVLDKRLSIETCIIDDLQPSVLFSSSLFVCPILKKSFDSEKSKRSISVTDSRRQTVGFVYS